MSSTTNKRRGSPAGVPKRPQLKVIRQLRQWIREGVLEAGDRVPAERRLASELDVDRGTVRRALETLEADGWIGRSEKGTRIVAGAAQSATQALLQQSIVVLTPVPEGGFVGHKAPGWSEFVSHGAIHAVRTAGRQVVALEPGSFGKDGFDELIAGRPAGLVVTDCVWDTVKPWLSRIRAAGIPLVVYGDDPEMAPYDRVSSDHEWGSYVLTQWALDQGLTRVGVVWRQPYHGFWCPLRIAGYQRAMSERGLDPGPVIEWQQVSEECSAKELQEETVRRIAGRLIEHVTGNSPLQAILVPSDGELYPAHRALRLFGLEPGKDVLMLGYDNYWTDCIKIHNDPTPPAATVDKLRVGAEITSHYSGQTYQPTRRLLPH